MSKAKATFHSILWNHTGKIAEYILMYAASILIARGLGAAENGTFVGLLSLSQLLLVLCSLGLETSLNKFIPQLAHENNDAKIAFALRRLLLLRITTCFAVGILFYATLVLFAVPLLGQSHKVLLFVLLFTWIRSIYPLFAMVLTAQLRTILTTRISVTIRSVELLAILLLMQFSLSVEKLILLFLTTSALHVVAYAIFSRIRLLGPAEAVDMKPMIQFGTIYWINTLVDFILGRQGDILFLTNLLPDPSQAGLYDVAYSLAQMTSMGATLGFAGVTFATFARLAVSDRETMDRFYGFSVRLISLLTIPFYTFLIFYAHELIVVLYSNEYVAAASLIQGILVFRITSRLFGGGENAEYLLSCGKVGTLVGMGVLAAFLNVTLNLVLVPQFGAWGSVIAGGCGNLLVNILGALGVYKLSINRVQLIFWMKLVIVCNIAAVITWYVVPAGNEGFLLLAGLSYAILLSLLFLFLKPLTRNDFAWLSQIDGRLANVLQYFSRVSLQPTSDNV